MTTNVLPHGSHPDWCARGHRCGLGEHRAQPVSLDAGRRGVVVLTRVRGVDGRQYVEITTRITLASGEAQARAHLAHIVTLFYALLRHAVRR